jgi:hypothetical protein
VTPKFGTENILCLLLLLALFGFGYWHAKGTYAEMTPKDAGVFLITMLVFAVLGYFLFDVLGWSVPDCEGEWWC